MRRRSNSACRIRFRTSEHAVVEEVGSETARQPDHPRSGLIFHVAASTAAVISPVTTRRQRPGQRQRRGRGPSDRRKRLREGRKPRRGLAAAELAAPRLHPKPELDRGRRCRGNANAKRRHRRLQRRRKTSATISGAKMTPMHDQHHFDLGAGDAGGRQRRGRDQIGGVLAGNRQPCQAAGKLARRHHDDRRDQQDARRSCRQNFATACSAGGARYSSCISVCDTSQGSRRSNTNSLRRSACCREPARNGFAPWPRWAGAARGRDADDIIGKSRRKDRHCHAEHDQAGRQQAQQRLAVAEHRARRPPQQAVRAPARTPPRRPTSGPQTATACR